MCRINTVGQRIKKRMNWTDGLCSRKTQTIILSTTALARDNTRRIRMLLSTLAISLAVVFLALLLI